MRNNLEAIVQEKPSKFSKWIKNSKGFVMRKALPWMLLGALAVGAYTWQPAPNEPKFHRYGNIEISEPIRLTDGWCDDTPAWSPDSTKLAYNAIEDTNKNNEVELAEDRSFLCVVDVDKKESKKIYEGVVGRITWVHTPDGEFIYFLSRGEGGYDIYRIKPDGGGLENITNTPYIANTPYSEEGFLLTSQRDKIIYSVFLESKTIPSAYSVWIMDVDGKNKEKLLDYVDLYVTSISQDGKKFLFQRRIDTNNDGNFEFEPTQVFEYDLETNQERQLTEYGINGGALYCNDGKTIIYNSGEDLNKDGKADYEHSYKIHVMNSDGTEDRRLIEDIGYKGGYEGIKVNDTNIDYLVVSLIKEDVNGDGIISTMDVSENNLYLLSAEGKELVKLGSWPDYFEVAVSPDGKYIAHVKLIDPPLPYPHSGWSGTISNIYMVEIKIKK